MARAWQSLLTSVRTGRPAYADVFGRSFWDDLSAHPEIEEQFDALMGPGHGDPDPAVLIDDDWTGVRTVVDVGGGTGSLLAAILAAHPELHGTLVDRPATVARATDSLRQAPLGRRVRLAGQSFFDPLPSGADLYLLKNVLPDWPDEDARVILRRCADAARPDGRIVIVSGISPDNAGGPPPELLMLVLVGGKGRNLVEFRTLAQSAGLRVEKSGPSGRWAFVVECRPDRSA
jgi:SAM-dependent methyltransferase